MLWGGDDTMLRGGDNTIPVWLSVMLQEENNRTWRTSTKASALLSSIWEECDGQQAAHPFSTEDFMWIDAFKWYDLLFVIANEGVERREMVHMFHFCFLLFWLASCPHKEEYLNELSHSQRTLEWVKWIKSLQKADYPTLTYNFNDQPAAAHGNLCLSVVRSLLYKFQ